MHESAPPGGERQAAGADAHLLMLVAVFIFSANYVVARGIHEDCPPFTLGFARWGGAALLLAPFVWRAMRQDWPLARAHWRRLTAAGVLMPFVGAGLSYVALNWTSAVNASVVQTSLPVLIVLIARAVLKERIGRVRAAGVAVALIGVLGIVARGDLALLSALDFNRGDLLLLLCTAGLASYAVLLKNAPPLRPLTLLFVVCAVGGAVHAPFVAGELIAGDVVRLTPQAVGGLLFVAVFPSIVAILLWHHGIARLGPSRSGVYMYFIPVFTAAMGFAILGEDVLWYHFAGAAAIVAGVSLASRTSA